MFSRESILNDASNSTHIQPTHRGIIVFSNPESIPECSRKSNSIWPIDMVLPLRSQSGPGSDGNKGVLRIPQSSSITGTSPLNCLVSYRGHLLWGSFSSAVNIFRLLILIDKKHRPFGYYLGFPPNWIL